MDDRDRKNRHQISRDDRAHDAKDDIAGFVCHYPMIRYTPKMLNVSNICVYLTGDKGMCHKGFWEGEIIWMVGGTVESTFQGSKTMKMLVI